MKVLRRTEEDEEKLVDTFTFEAEDRADEVMLRGILGGIGGFYRNFTYEGRRLTNQTTERNQQ